MSQLEYSVVIATRNRPSALRLSIPRMLSQSRPPSQLIVIDSSDDHEAVVDAVRESVGTHPVDLTIRHSGRGLTLQRNAGLELLRHPVVFFPDDDSIWFPGVAAIQLEVYERDQEKQIAAVCAAESATPPQDWELPASGAYAMRRSHRLQQRFAALRAKVENTFFPDPARLLGQSFWPPQTSLPDWFAKEEVVLVEWMTGFRMSFRTEVIQKVRFDETFSRYSLFEDIDASFGSWRHGWVVGARKARVYHYRSPEKRDQGRRLGVEQLLNKAYVIGKHSVKGHLARKRMLRFGRYKALQYLAGARDHFGSERYAGARAAIRELPQLVRAQDQEVAKAYKTALAKSL